VGTKRGVRRGAQRCSTKVATYGGEQFSSVTYYMDGFYDGVQYYNTKMKPKVPVAVLVGTRNPEGTSSTPSPTRPRRN